MAQMPLLDVFCAKKMSRLGRRERSSNWSQSVKSTILLSVLRISRSEIAAKEKWVPDSNADRKTVEIDLGIIRICMAKGRLFWSNPGRKLLRKFRKMGGGTFFCLDL
ncbi:hypothetical protein WJU16_21455 [Chitinophaga pollutisoli]|uniref:Transposase n=1 Tax=Chitinophaga pollutisoli TaxID=3133966 RepID=A0ABZ2YNQ1_9BACT